MRKRLIDQGVKPFLHQSIGDYQTKQMRSTLGRTYRIGDLAQVALGLYGALPMPPEKLRAIIAHDPRASSNTGAWTRTSTA